jgi:hypothetical protein
MSASTTELTVGPWTIWSWLDDACKGVDLLNEFLGDPLYRDHVEMT